MLGQKRWCIRNVLDSIAGAVGGEVGHEVRDSFGLGASWVGAHATSAMYGLISSKRWRMIGSELLAVRKR